VRASNDLCLKYSSRKLTKQSFSHIVILMSNMRKRIEAERANNMRREQEVQELANVQARSEASLKNERHQKLFKAVQGLRVLSRLLVDSDAEPVLRAKYRGGGRVTMLGKKELWAPSLKDPVWELGRWLGIASGGQNGSYTYPASNYITGSGKVIGHHHAFQNAVVDLAQVSISVTSSTDRLAILKPGYTKRYLEASEIAQQIIWTAAHYNLDWPEGAPDLTEL
jgi:hypothetical protein